LLVDGIHVGEYSRDTENITAPPVCWLLASGCPADKSARYGCIDSFGGVDYTEAPSTLPHQV
jgi:hypothetical protein